MVLWAKAKWMAACVGAAAVVGGLSAPMATKALAQEKEVAGVIQLEAPAKLDKPGGRYLLVKDVAADGTAFSVSADDITLDLGGHTVVYGNGKEKCYGVLVAGGNNFTLKNGVIIQGAGKVARSFPVFISKGTKGEVHHLVVKAEGPEVAGIYAHYGGEGYKVHHNFVMARSSTTAMGGGYMEGILFSEPGKGGAEIYENIVVGSHRGVGFSEVADSKIYRNLVQHERIGGIKAPYGVGVAGNSANNEVFENQMVSDNGRGIALDMGAKKTYVHDNLVDVQYSTSAAGSGGYEEDNVYGLRDRYRSGANRIEKNWILATNQLRGVVYGLYIGSDDSDPQMDGIQVLGNTVIVLRGKGQSAQVFHLDWVDKLTCRDNRYFTDGRMVQFGYERTAKDVTMENNAVLELPASAAPAAPKGLSLVRFLDCYLLRWEKNAEKDVLGYFVWRDGQKLPVSSRGGTFFVDATLEKGKQARYALSAVTLSLKEGERSAEVSTTQAAEGWK